VDVVLQLTIDGREEERTAPQAPRTSPAAGPPAPLFDAAPFAQQRGQLAADLELHPDDAGDFDGWTDADARPDLESSGYPGPDYIASIL
jgi:hypothetical protein